MSMQELRSEVAWFALQMEMALRRNDWKGGWENETPYALSHRVIDETAELLEAIQSWDKEWVVNEAVDIANFAMMIADNAQNRSG